MKIVKIGEPEVIMSNFGSKHAYFGWPTATRLQNGKIAVVASGFRRRHLCPFGKTVIAYSEDEGATYTAPAPVIDTVLDDRDGGILAYGERDVIVTSFNNSIAFQRNWKDTTAYDLAYLDTVMPEEEAAAVGSTFRISHDCGVTFGPILKSPITSPHGPMELPDGDLLWVGRVFCAHDTERNWEIDRIEAHRICADGTMKFVGAIENIVAEGETLASCEPHSILLKDGRILTQIRVQQRPGGKSRFTTYQCFSSDLGKTWTKPEPILEPKGGAPSHLFRHSSGLLLATYGYRSAPYGIRVMFSEDEGASWDTGNVLYETDVSPDLGYPSTVELSDGSMLTVFYALQKKDDVAVIMQQRWRFEK